MENHNVSQKMEPWTIAADAALAHFDTTFQGLTEAEARQRLERHGPNRLAQKPPRPAWMKFLDQFKDLLVIVLIGAAALAGAIGDIKDAVVILIVVVFNAALGFYQEHRAEATLAALKKMLAQHARVRRGGEVLEIAAEDLVPGDIVLLEAGDRIPADARVLAAHNAEVAEAALTGESNAVGKHAEALPPGEHPLAERFNMVFMNTVVTRGRIEALIAATGMETEMGRITGLLDTAEESPTPLQIQLDGLGKRLAIIAGVVVTLIFVLGILRGDPLVQTIMTSIALAVAAIPEGLPAVVTVTLAIGMHRMAKNRAIVKKLSAVETLGSTSVICSDKTGTLTLNQMTARNLFYRGRRFAVSGEGYVGEGEFAAEDGLPPPDFLPLLAPAALCNESRIRAGELIGDPTEGALLALAMKGGIEPDSLVEHSPRIAEIPFDSAHKFMATFHHDGERVRMFVKGAPDVLLARAGRHLDATAESPLDDAARAAFEAENARLAGQAMRVLAVASRDIPAHDFDPAGDLMVWAQQLTLVGLVGIIDPPRSEARDAIRLCKQAGIQVKMITGDHAITAAAIARELGLEGAVLTGAELDRIDVAELSRHIEETAVFARVAPEHKVKIVQALKARGHVVAMTGDGVNDGPALQEADIGIAMGQSGTDVAREAADLVLLDDDFATIVAAIEQGRSTFSNIRRFLTYHLTDNVAELTPFVVWALSGGRFPLALGVLQILALDIGTDLLPALALGAEPQKPEVRRQRPVRGHLTDRALLRRVFGVLGPTEAIVEMLAFVTALVIAGWRPGESFPTGHTLLAASGAAFSAVVMGQVGNAFACRSTIRWPGALGWTTNPLLLGAVVVEILALLAVLFIGPIAALLGQAPPPLAGAVVAVLAAPAVLITDALHKRWRSSGFRRMPVARNADSADE